MTGCTQAASLVVQMSCPRSDNRSPPKWHPQNYFMLKCSSPIQSLRVRILSLLKSTMSLSQSHPTNPPTPSSSPHLIAPLYTNQFMSKSESLYPIPLCPLITPTTPSQILQKMHVSLSDSQNMKNIMAQTRHPYAAVGMLIKPDGNTLRILLTKRVQNESDIFQGEVCLPGGMYQSTDRSLFDTVTREIHEELGIDVRRVCRFIGQIPASDILRFRLKGGMLGVVVYVFEYLKGDLFLKKDEVASAAWVDAAVFWRGRQEMMRRLELPLAKITKDETLRSLVEKEGLTVEASNVVFSDVRVVRGSEDCAEGGVSADGSWMIWGLTLETVMAVFQYGASLPAIFPYSLSSPDPVVNQIVQFNWAFSKAFMEAAWCVLQGSESAKVICDGVILEIMKLKEEKAGAGSGEQPKSKL